MWDQSGDTEAEMLEMEEMRKAIREMQEMKAMQAGNTPVAITIPELGFPTLNH